MSSSEFFVKTSKFVTFGSERKMEHILVKVELKDAKSSPA